MKAGWVVGGAVLLLIGIMVFMYGFGGLQAINSPAGQILLFLSTPEERSAAWARVYGIIGLGAILCVIGFVLVIVGAVKKEEE